MPKLNGVFDQFQNLDEIPIHQVSSWLKFKGEIHSLANFIGNRITYASTIPLSPADLEIDLALLHEAVILEPDKLYSESENKIIIPQEFVLRFPPLPKLATTLIESLNPPGTTTIYIKNQKQLKLVGSVIRPDLSKIKFTKQDKVAVTVNGQPSELNLNSLNVAALKDSKIKIKIDSLEEQVASGGELGIIIDLRKVNK